jgi:hypothetical protein
MTRFREYVHSPYFNKHNEVRALIAYLSDIYPDFNAENCHREMLSHLLYPGDAHDQQKLALILTYAMRLLESFLAQAQLEQESAVRQVWLLRSLREKKRYQLYEKILRKAEQQLAEAAQLDHTHYHRAYRLAAEADLYYNQIERRKTDLSIQRKQNNLDAFYILEKLRDACEMQVRRRILNVDYSTRMLEAVIREVEENAAEYADEPLLLIYFQIYQMVSDGQPTHYFQALATLQQYEAQFAMTELSYIYNYLQNYCIQQINRGNRRFLEEIFKLYKAQLVRGLLAEGDYLSEWHYKNIVTTGIRLGKMDWVRDFIEHYTEKLAPESQENAYRFNLASYHYAVQEYDKVLDLLVKVEYSDLRYSLGAKALLLRTYYDLDEYEALISLTQAFTIYLRRNKLLAGNQRDGHANLFKLAKRAAQIRSKMGYTKPEKLQQQLKKLQTDIAETTVLFNREWLLEKTNELAADIQPA